MKNCDECVFGRFYTSDGNLTRICHAKNTSSQEAISAIKSDDCDMYKEGHGLWTKYKDGEYDNLTASKMYILDRKDYSKEPVAICKSFYGETDENCHRGENGYCYCRLGCTGQTELNGNGKMLPEMRKAFGTALAKGIAMQREKESHRR